MSKILSKSFKKNLPLITNPITFTKNGPTPDGLYSEVIYGKRIEDQKKYALIDLKVKVITPHIFKNLNKIAPIFQKIAENKVGATIVNGVLVELENKPKSGINFLYENWEKIDFTRYPKKYLNIENIEKIPKDDIFIDKIVVMPPFYRPYIYKNGIPIEDELTMLYKSLIQYAGNKSENQYLQHLVKEEGTQQLIQRKVNEIAEFIFTNFKEVQEEKLIGKKMDNITRLVANADPIIPLDSVGIPWMNLAIIFDTFFWATIEHSPNKLKYLKDLEFDNMPTPEQLGQFLDFIYRNVNTFVKNSPKKKETIIEILEEMFNDKPELCVSLKRDPAWDKNSFHSLKPIIITDDSSTVIVNSMIYKPIGGDSFKTNIMVFQKNTKVVFENENFKCSVPKGKAKIIKRSQYISRGKNHGK